MAFFKNFKICVAFFVTQIFFSFLTVAQEQSHWSFSSGLSVYNIYNEGNFTTSSPLAAIQGFNMSPSFLLNRNFDSGSSIGVRYELGSILSLSPINNSPWLISQRTLYQILYRHPFKSKLYLQFGVTAIDFKALNYFSIIIGKQRIINQLGPALGIGFKLQNNYYFELQNDIFWDFIQGEPYFFFGHLKARITKELVGQTTGIYFLKGNAKWDIGVKFGVHMSYNYYRTYFKYMPIVQSHLFGELYSTHSKSGLTFFWRRSFWVDLQPLERMGSSEYLTTNNFGVILNSSKSKNHFGISYFNANESLYRKLRYSADSIPNSSAINMRGFSVHYERQLNGPMYFSSQVDVNLTKYSFMNNWNEFVRPRLGLAFKL